MTGNTAKIEPTLAFGGQLNKEMVDIFVGPQKQHFHIHKAVLVAHSDYFKGMFLRGFKEGNENSATLPEDDPEIFDLFLQWIYGQKHLPPAKAVPDADDTDFTTRIRLYGFAEKYCIPELGNYLITNIVSVCRYYYEWPSIEEIVAAFEYTSSANSPIRALMIHYLQCVIKTRDENSTWSAQSLSQGLSEHAEIINDLILLIRKGDEVEDPNEKDPCTYHTHTNGEQCVPEELIL